MTALNRLLQRLFDADIDFVIIGGFGAMLHGSSLLTRDLDVCAVLTAENLEKCGLRSAQRASFLENPEHGAALKNLYLQTDLGPLDLIKELRAILEKSRR